jgi:hypothetical protein
MSICKKCNKEIFWRPKLLDPEIYYSGPKPLNEDGTLHICDISVQRYPRVKASVIICPIKNCNFPCVEGDKKLIDEFQSHMKKHLIYNGRYDKVEERIEYLRSNNYVHYQDPFLYVSLQEILTHNFPK